MLLWETVPTLLSGSSLGGAHGKDNGFSSEKARATANLKHMFNNQGCKIKGTNVEIYAGYASLAIIELGDTGRVLELRRRIEMAIIASMHQLKSVHCSNHENDDGSNQGTMPDDDQIHGFGAQPCPFSCCSCCSEVTYLLLQSIAHTPTWQSQSQPPSQTDFSLGVRIMEMPDHVRREWSRHGTKEMMLTLSTLTACRLWL